MTETKYVYSGEILFDECGPCYTMNNYESYSLEGYVEYMVRYMREILQDVNIFNTVKYMIETHSDFQPSPGCTNDTGAWIDQYFCKYRIKDLDDIVDVLDGLKLPYSLTIKRTQEFTEEFETVVQFYSKV